MELKIKASAAEYLASKITPNDQVLLVLDDGSNKFSNMGGSCTIGSKFQLVLMDQPDPDYSIKLTNNLGWNISTGSDELTYLSDGLSIDYHNAFMVLGDNSGIIDGALSIAKYKAPTAAALKAQMQTDGLKNC